MPASEEFRTFAQLLAPPPAPSAACAPQPLPEPPREEDADLDAERRAILASARLFHARLREMMDEARDALLCDLACEVLARELAIAPADVQRIIERLYEQFAHEEPIAVRVHPADAHAVRCGLPIREDAALQPGDAVLELRFGSVDARLGVRLESVLDRET